MGVIIYVVGMALINAPAWVWSKITGKPFKGVGGPQG
jgi:hypothetical protein